MGHNDIKEITFNDGEVAISGNMVNTIDSLAKVSQDLEYRIKEVEERSMKMSYDLLTRTDALNQQVDINMANTKAALQNANELIKQQSDEIKVLNARIDVLKTLIEKYHPEE